MDTQERMTPDQLRHVRETLDMSAVTLAERLKVRADTYRRWERGADPIPYGAYEDLQWIVEQQIQRLQNLLALDLAYGV